jgi:adenosylcobyric acid synthase
VKVLYIDSADEAREVDAIIIPGTKNTIEDLKWMRERGIDRAIVDRAGEIPILGICGGYQMLGSRITDMHGLEGDEGAEVDGLGLLEMSTRFDRYEKRTVQVEGEFLLGGKVRGYEIHMGTTEAGRLPPLFKLTDQDGEHLEGGWDERNMVFGTYLHGVFDLPSFRRYFLDLIEPMERSGEGRDYDSVVEENLDLLAEMVAEAMDMDRFLPRFGLEGK